MTVTKMGQKNIPVDHETYEMLKSLKKDTESFRELILRLIKGQNDRILRHYGSWEMDDDEVEDIFNTLNEGWSGWGK